MNSFRHLALSERRVPCWVVSRRESFDTLSSGG